MIAEVSSFQLESIRSFKPRISCIINITPDHLDRYHSMDEYAEAKFRIFANQGPGDTFVGNLDDPIVAGRAGRRRQPHPRARAVVRARTAPQHDALHAQREDDRLRAADRRPAARRDHERRRDPAARRAQRRQRDGRDPGRAGGRARPRRDRRRGARRSRRCTTASRRSTSATASSTSTTRRRPIPAR